MEEGYFVYFDACHGVTPVRLTGEWTDYVKGQCVVLAVALPVAAVIFWMAGLI
jgi:hypothetical protein